MYTGGNNRQKAVSLGGTGTHGWETWGDIWLESLLCLRFGTARIIFHMRCRMFLFLTLKKDSLNLWKSSLKTGKSPTHARML